MLTFEEIFEEWESIRDFADLLEELADVYRLRQLPDDLLVNPPKEIQRLLFELAGNGQAYSLPDSAIIASSVKDWVDEQKAKLEDSEG